MQKAPKSLRLHIGIFGRRNVGKSSLLNAITRQNVAIVSNVAGTTTDPIEKPMELLPIGPVLFIDTAGIDDIGSLGALRIEKTKKVFSRTDLGIIVTDNNVWGEFEEKIFFELRALNIPIIIVRSKIDTENTHDKSIEYKNFPQNISIVATSSTNNIGILDLRSAILKNTPKDFLDEPALVSDLVPAGELAILVVPIDKEAPKGRLIMPQVQAIRDLLDGDAYCLVVKERELAFALKNLIKKPKLVVTDSSCFLKVAADVPDDILMTSFSILFARFKGDLLTQVKDTMVINSLKPGDKILISESCSHHPITEDIGRVKIPRWLTQYVGGKLNFTIKSGHDFPENLEEYKLVIHCGGCMLNRKEMLTRTLYCKNQNVPITNYGLAISYSLGIFARALKPFPAAFDLYNELTK